MSSELSWKDAKVTIELDFTSHRVGIRVGLYKLTEEQRDVVEGAIGLRANSWGLINKTIENTVSSEYAIYEAMNFIRPIHSLLSSMFATYRPKEYKSSLLHPVHECFLIQTGNVSYGSFYN